LLSSFCCLLFVVFFSLGWHQVYLVSMNTSSSSDSKRDLLRHALATVAYRGGKAIRIAPADFANFRAAEGVRTPGQILAHIGDLFDWALSIAAGYRTWKDSSPSPWEKEIERFFAACEEVRRLSGFFQTAARYTGKALPGPVADALTHVGQIATLRRMAGAPVRGESYFDAEVVVGRVGAEQVPPEAGVLTSIA